MCRFTIFAGEAETLAEEIAVQVDGTAGQHFLASVVAEGRNLDLVLDFLGRLPEFFCGGDSCKEWIGCGLNLAVNVHKGCKLFHDGKGFGAAAAHVVFIADEHQFAHVELIQAVKPVDVA